MRVHPTDREMQVLHYLAEGMTNQQIADKLHLGEATVKSHIRHLFDKLGVYNRCNLLIAALLKGYIELEDLSINDGTITHNRTIKSHSH